MDINIIIMIQRNVKINVPMAIINLIFNAIQMVVLQIQIYNDSNKCQSIYNYCYIDEHYQNQCSNEKKDTYLYSFNKTNQYLKECSDSLTYTTSELNTYLYNGTCYLNCPENTVNNK